jgi:hypothetical protein
MDGMNWQKYPPRSLFYGCNNTGNMDVNLPLETILLNKHVTDKL